MPLYPDDHIGVIACRHVVSGDRPVKAVLHDEDGDWQFMCGDRHSAEDSSLVGLNHLIHQDGSLKEILGLEKGHSADRDAIGSVWVIEKYEEHER